MSPRRRSTGECSDANPTRCGVVENFYGRERAPDPQAALRSDRAESARASARRRDGAARPDGLRQIEPSAFGKNTAAVGGPADGHRDRRQPGKDRRVPASAGQDDGLRTDHGREGAGTTIRRREIQNLIEEQRHGKKIYQSGYADDAARFYAGRDDRRSVEAGIYFGPGRGR